MEEILSTAEEILGVAVRVEVHRDWAIFWCPFHNDASRQGEGGQPNFGINLTSGYWKCLRCGASGSSLKALQRKLGKPIAPSVSVARPRSPKRLPTQVPLLDEAVSEARASLQQSPAWPYLAKRGVLPYTALVYGLGYGKPKPIVGKETLEAARQSMMVRHDGTWLWAGGVVYADPPTQPCVLNVRYIPDELLPEGTRTFTIAKHHKTWGNRISPLGSWRITPTTTKLIVLEGFFDMLITAQKVYQLGRSTDTVAIYTNGASPSAKMQQWFREHPQYEYILIRDPDKAGIEWGESVSASIRHGGGMVRVLCPPEQLDPDEAILDGWWPAGI